MKVLDRITLVIVDCKNYSQALSSLKQTLKRIQPAKTLFFTDIDFDPKDERITVIKIPSIKSLKEYSHFIIKELYSFINTDFILIQQWDSWVINEEVWTDEFMEYDVLGATWGYKDGRNVGQGGFCLHSKHLHQRLAGDPKITITFPDDEVIARLYRDYLEKEHGIKYAPESLANRFSFELNAPTAASFGFHSFFHAPFKDHVIIKRDASMGDILMCEPIIQYYHDKGYQVVLDTQPQFMSLFFQHPFPIKHISQMNPTIVPIKTIDLDMAYEMKPKQPVLKSYIEKAGIEIPLRNSRLNVFCPPEWKIFKKYVLIHADTTGIPHRDINDLDWRSIVKYLKKQGFDVFQIGKRIDEEVATHFNTPTIEALMYLIKGANIVIGLDSGNCQISVALGVPTIIMAGSVNLSYRYNDFTNIRAIQGACPKDETAYCYHNSIGVVGQDCVYNKHMPPCTYFKADDVIDAIIDLTKNK